MNVLVIGSGGREHALVWKIKQSRLVDRIYCAPGNAGIGESAKLVSIPSSDIDALVRFAVDNDVDLTVVGPEQPLSEGIVDRFESKGLKIFGPTKAAARLEGSKVFAKEFMKRHGIPTARFETFTHLQASLAEKYIDEGSFPVVIKADGLAAGKGVIICETRAQAIEAIRTMMRDRIFGEAGTSIVVEEFLEGEEATVFALTDGVDAVMLAPAQDHKRILDGDLGKNTGGMGAYAPAPVMTPDRMEEVKRAIILPSLRAMANDGSPYKGCLYVGLMITPSGPKVIEFNCRFGDPETQVVLPLLESDLVPLMMSTIQGDLSQQNIRQRNNSAVCVVMASRGYPGAYETGKPISGLENALRRPDVMVFHSGTKKNKNVIETSGGRVLGVTAVGPGNALSQTINRAYAAVDKITFEGAYYRTDIGKKGLQRMNNYHTPEVR